MWIIPTFFRFKGVAPVHGTLMRMFWTRMSAVMGVSHLWVLGLLHV